MVIDRLIGFDLAVPHHLYHKDMAPGSHRLISDFSENRAYAAAFAAANTFHQLFFDWELAIPFLPGMIYIYASLLLLLLLPALALTRRQLPALARAMVITLFSAAVVYLLLPADLGFERPEYVPGYNGVYQALYALELPHNLVPSLHIASSTLLIATLLHNSSSVWVRLGLYSWGLLICASVLLVHQHHVLDVISGLMLGLVCYRRVYLRALL